MSDPAIITDSLVGVIQTGISLVGVVVAMYAVYVAKKNLETISKELTVSLKGHRLEHLKVVLEIETQMNSRKLEFDKASKDVRLDEGRSEEKSEILADYLDATKESYLNSLDRLCFCIRHKYLNDKDWRVEYRNVVFNVIQEFPTDFDEASPYVNIKEVNKLWQSS
ncbi:TPA: hypothetical protein RUZ21_003392 [Vibrio cholerae]|nr:hypothetical protein CGT71_18570 [Vibrio cholerae]HDZ9230652.1 hypothetical protein [Vibrio cholerae]